MKTADAGANKWRDRFGSSADHYRNGVQSTTKDPTAAAAAAVNIWATKVSSQATRDKFARKLQKVSKADWQAAAVKGADRLSAGADKGAPKYLKAAQTLYPYISTVVGGLPARTGTIDGSIARSTAMIRGMSQYKG